ncbi:MAG: helix-turn-helix domain-containing protein [Candidatus Brocadiae bacterium]|nr:helix-turn-helix domain-containing protein [Candidatus Brocadiia bacterium]
MAPDLTVHDVAELTGVHAATVRRLARAGRLPGAYKIGRQWRFAREAIEHLRGQVIRSTYHADIRLSGLHQEEPE